MEDHIYQAYLEALSKKKPFDVCRYCIKETTDLLEVTEISDFNILYTNITNVEAPLAEAAPNLVCSSCISMLRQTSAFKEMLHNTAIFWDTFLSKVPPTEETNSLTPVTVMIKEELDEDSLMRETIYLSTSYQQDEDAIEEITLHTVGSDVEDEVFSVDSKPEVNVLNLPVKKETGFCEICYTDVERYKYHAAVHKKYSNCAHCGMAFLTKNVLLQHLQDAHANYDPVYNGKAYCTICQKEFQSHVLWRKHIKLLHYKINKIACPFCDRMFSNTRKLYDHKRHHNEKKAHCTLCPKRFIDSHRLQVHMVSHKNERPFLCELCGLATKHKANMKRHMLGVHANQKQKAYAFVAKCSLCQEKFNGIGSFEMHVAERHPEQADGLLNSVHRCKLCSKNFATFDQLEQHNRENIEKHKRYVIRKRNYCKNYNIRKLAENPDVHKPVPKKPSRNFACEICKNTFKTTTVLKNHMAKHSNAPRPFQCNTCGATYRRSNDLSLHIKRVHTGERPFACDQCDYKCLTKHELNSHNKLKHKKE